MPPTPFRYRAFISYCHAERKEATRLQNAIERFRPPRGDQTGDLPPGRLRPVFRDRDALGSSHDLSTAIRDALDESQTLVVVCSPAAAASRWVAREVEHFAARRGREQIFCFVIAGEPNAADPAQECLPPPLRRAQCGAEVLAADARPSGDGWRDAVLKIAAGITGLPFAQLARREQKQARRRALAWAATGLLLASIFGALALHSARQARAAEEAARHAEIIADYLADILTQLGPHYLDNTARAALLPFIDASARPDRLQRLGGDPRALLRVRHILARAYLELQAADRARPLYEENLALATALHGPDHPLTASNLAALGNTLNALGQSERAEEIHRRLLDIALRTHGEKSIEAIRAMTNLAISAAQAGRAEEAAALRTRVYEIGRSFLPPDNLPFQGARRNYAGVLWAQGRLDEALQVAEELHRDQLASPGPDHLATLETEGFLGELLEQLGQPARAADAYTKAAAGLVHIHGADDSRALFCAYRLAIILQKLGRPDEARQTIGTYFGNPPDPEKISRIGGKVSDLTCLKP